VIVSQIEECINKENNSIIIVEGCLISNASRKQATHSASSCCRGMYRIIYPASSRRNLENAILGSQDVLLGSID
jgi:uncharacterized protein (DUF779 family)